MLNALDAAVAAAQAPVAGIETIPVRSVADVLGNSSIRLQVCWSAPRLPRRTLLRHQRCTAQRTRFLPSSVPCRRGVHAVMPAPTGGAPVLHALQRLTRHATPGVCG